MIAWQARHFYTRLRELSDHCTNILTLAATETGAAAYPEVDDISEQMVFLSLCLSKTVAPDLFALRLPKCRSDTHSVFET